MAASIKLTIASHHFKVDVRTESAKQMLFDFTRGFVKVDIQGNNRTVTTFAAANRDRTWFRFHINALEDFYMFARNRNYPKDSMEIEVRPYAELKKIDLQTRPHWVVRPDQEPLIEYLTKPLAANEPKSRMVPLQTGQGKFQPLSSKIKVPGGWKTMGEMQVGTFVTAIDGTKTRVNGVFPQGKKPVYRVTFADGRSTLAGGEHLWKVYYINTVPHKRWRVVDTLEMQRLIAMPNPRVYIPLCDSELGWDAELPLDPYVLGLLIGNGSYTQNTVTYTTRDLETVDTIASKLPVGFDIRLFNQSNENKLECYFVRSPFHKDGPIFKTVIEKLGIHGQNSYTKTIPDVYLHASTEQRWELLRGLLDSDGTLNRDGSGISYTTSSSRLASDVQYLVRSLGGFASLRSRIPTYTHNGEKKKGALSYTVGIHLKKPSMAFKLSRKKDLTNDDNQYSAGLKLRVSSIEYVGEEETQCISVEHSSHLYITDDFIVTHNTFTAVKALSLLSYKFVCILKPKYVEKWVADLSSKDKGILDIKPEEIMVVQGSAALQALTQMAVTAGALDKYKVFIFSNRTYDNYLKAYEQLGSGIEEMGYMLTPDELFEKLQVGVRLIDEVHEEFHANFRLDLYTHVHLSISLSATLISRDPTLLRMYEVAYPSESRYKAPPLIKSATAWGVYYRANPSYKIRTTERGQSSYSHNAYEGSILKNPNFTFNYGWMIKNYLDKGYIKEYEPGNKAIVFASTVAMCTKLTEQLSNWYPDKTVRRFVMGDNYQKNYQDPDIRVTTIGSGGTGHDIKNLTDAHMTNAIDSIQANIQAFGRLRNLLPKETRFFFYTNEGIDKHMNYHKKKSVLMKERALSYASVQYDKQL